MTIWADGNEEAYKGRRDPYDGCLVVFNVGQDNESQLTEHQREMVHSEVENAHARGWLIIYSFDKKVGWSPPPSFVTNMEDMDFPILAKAIFQVDDVNLLYRPNDKSELDNLASMIFSQQGVMNKFKFAAYNAKFLGFVTVDGNKVFMPSTTI